MANNTVLCVIFLATGIISVNKAELFVPNLDLQCLTCLCVAASGCNLGIGCSEGFCGPFQISRAYWIDAGRQTLEGQNPAHPNAHPVCATNYRCSQNVVKHYIAKFAQDCNGDGVTNCDDFAMINYNGGYNCNQDLSRHSSGRVYALRYTNCTLQNQ